MHPNDIWQADHTELDLMVLDETGRPVLPWLTVILDDRSALRQAIWRKTDPEGVGDPHPAEVVLDRFGPTGDDGHQGGGDREPGPSGPDGSDTVAPVTWWRAATWARVPAGCPARP